ncbi:amino acid adenylation domain-containing protein [Rhodoferax ferrireducens]|uniref:amino acid adenylation domain-containing protein n=1 Tax=Rhodoferax ferrireducens TaxID=192843 RepID=UPI000E0CFFED|nr:amino acid adenylation domain-containing protein [Rhodoferax ferrireducens]
MKGAITMETQQALHQGFVAAAQRYPGHTAVIEPGFGQLSYAELAELSDRVRDRLHASGVRSGDRVGLYMRKSIDAVATLYGILKAGAAYVPVDPAAPVARCAYILHNCGVKLALVEQRFETRLTAESEALGGVPALLLLESVGGGVGLRQALDQADARQPAPVVASVESAAQDLAYILYTSGSTGKPKGVMLTHENAVSFVDWCAEVFEPLTSDRFSSHAPLHFDLSILDIHLPLKHGAALVLIAEEAGKDPLRLAPLIAEQRITCWYSAPSILSLLAQYGNLAQQDLSALRMVLFAGEVFPVRHLRTLTELLPMPRYFNLYGPTETNVCTWYELALPVPPERSVPFPIGKVCSHLRAKVVDEHGHEVAPGGEGELCISGSGVMQGYWALPEQSKSAFLTRDYNGDQGVRWYRTGDIVVEAEDGNYTYLGRRDRMVKRRGYRVELGEIEAGLYRHGAIKEAAVVALADEEGVRIKAVLSCREAKRPSMIEMKRFCAENLPLYMVPDQFIWCDSLPKTSTDKVDYQRLKEMN